MSYLKRFNPETIYGEMPWYSTQADMEEWEDGEYVLYEDYKDLLDKYEDLKYRMDGLEK